MQPGQMVFTKMERVVFGQPAADAIVQETDRRRAKRVFILASGTLARETDEIQKVADALGDRYAGMHDHMPAHSPRSAVVACANAARDAGADLLVNIGGGSTTDGAKAVTICLEHNVTDEDGLEPFRTVVKEGVRNIPDFAAPKVRQLAVPTTLSAGEFNARAGVTDTRLGLKQSFMHPGIIPAAVYPRRSGHRPHTGVAVAVDRHPRCRSRSRNALLYRCQRLHRWRSHARVASVECRVAWRQSQPW